MPEPLSRLRILPIAVHDEAGVAWPAEMAICAKCRASKFMICWVKLSGRRHLHFECIDCSTSYCDGTCEGASP